jgi:hypothetical protein
MTELEDFCSGLDNATVAPDDATVAPDSYANNQTRKMAEKYLVAYDINRRGFECAVGRKGDRFDIWADIGGKIRRIQVKSSESPRAESKKQSNCDADLFAFVDLDKKQIVYALPNGSPGEEAS